MVDTGSLGGTACGGIEYPNTGFFGENILFPSRDRVALDTDVEMAVKLAPTATLRFKVTALTPLDENGGYTISSDNDFRSRVAGPSALLWEPKFAGSLAECWLSFHGTGRELIEYFECDSETPTGTKLLSWGAPP
jgi:hypothetical protein